MKKTLLILLTSISFLSVTACYTAPEMDELKYKVDYEEGGCNVEADYMHEGLRNCIESRIAYNDENKKTVTIVPTKDGTLVIPRTYDDETMMDTSRIYERVDINDTSVVIEDGSAPKDVGTESVGESKTDVTIVEVSKTASEEVVVKKETADESEKTEETIVETEIVADPEIKVTAEVVAEPETVVEVEKTRGDIEVKKTITVSQKEAVESEAASSAATTKEIGVNTKETVTVVVDPMKKDVVVSIGAVGEGEPAPKQEKAETFEKNEKEVLPIEEK